MSARNSTETLRVRAPVGGRWRASGRRAPPGGARLHCERAGQPPQRTGGPRRRETAATLVTGGRAEGLVARSPGGVAVCKQRVGRRCPAGPAAPPTLAPDSGIPTAACIPAAARLVHPQRLVPCLQATAEGGTAAGRSGAAGRWACGNRCSTPGTPLRAPPGTPGAQRVPKPSPHLYPASGERGRGRRHPHPRRPHPHHLRRPPRGDTQVLGSAAVSVAAPPPAPSPPHTPPAQRRSQACAPAPSATVRGSPPSKSPSSSSSS
jgi:hypothetical protein